MIKNNENATIIMFSDDSDEATICTFSKTEKEKLKAICEAFPDIARKKSNNEFVVSKKILKIGE